MFRKYGLGILQTVVSLFLIYRIFSSPVLRAEISQVLGHANLGWLLVGLGFALSSEFLCAVRWWLVLAAFGIPIRFKDAIIFCGAGAFFSLGLPGMGGGDAFRMFYIVRSHPDRKLVAILSVLADRLCGLAALIISLAFTVASRHALFARNADTRVLLKLSVMLLGGVVCLVFLWWLTTKPWAQRLPFPKRLLPLRQRIDRLGGIFSQLGERPRWIVGAMVISTVGLAFHFGTYLMSARAFALPVGPSEMFTVMPLVDTLILLPISLFGVGVRENLFERLLGGLFGIPHSGATLTSLGGFLLQAAVALLGAALVPLAKANPALREAAEVGSKQPDGI